MRDRAELDLSCSAHAKLDIKETKHEVPKVVKGERFKQQQGLLTDLKGDVEKVEVFRIEIDVHVLHEFVGFHPKGGNREGGKAVEGSIL